MNEKKLGWGRIVLLAQKPLPDKKMGSNKPPIFKKLKWF
jgi:hypothetical protein